jgi:rfaE bifunctional protein kinase chain/domain
MTLDTSLIKNILDTIKDKRVVVVGDFMIDRYLTGIADRISPEGPVPIVEITGDEMLPGGAGNVVSNLFSLGAKSTVVGLVGKDEHGRTLRKILESKGSCTEGLIATADRPTTVKTRVIANKQQVVRVDREKTGYPDSAHLNTLIERAIEAIKGADAIILQDYNKGVLHPELIRATIDTANSFDIPVLVDPKVENFFEYWGATVFKPNTRIAQEVLGRNLGNNESFEKAGYEILLRLQAEMLLMTRSQHGMSLVGNNKKPKHIPAVAKRIADVSGAGDTVISTMALGLVAGLGGYEAALLATKAAGYVVSLPGAVPVTPEALLTESGD